MKPSRLIAAARSPAGRLVAVICGMAAVAFILHRIGFGTVGSALAGTAMAFPIVLALEAGVSTCTMMAVRSTYGPIGRAIPAAKRCLDLAAKLQVVDERAKACEAWLIENDAAHFRRGGELVPRLRAGAPVPESPLVP